MSMMHELRGNSSYASHTLNNMAATDWKERASKAMTDAFTHTTALLGTRQPGLAPGRYCERA